MVTQAKKQRDLKGLCWIAREKGYAEGWVAHKFRELFGAFPDDQFDRDAAPPTKKLESWVKQESRAFALRRKRSERRKALRNGAARVDGMSGQGWRSHMKSITGKSV